MSSRAFVAILVVMVAGCQAAVPPPPSDAGPRPDAREPPPAYVSHVVCNGVRPECPISGSGLPGCVVDGRFSQTARCEYQGVGLDLTPYCRMGRVGCWSVR